MKKKARRSAIRKTSTFVFASKSAQLPADTPLKLLAALHPILVDKRSRVRELESIIDLAFGKNSEEILSDIADELSALSEVEGHDFLPDVLERIGLRARAAVSLAQYRSKAG